MFTSQTLKEGQRETNLQGSSILGNEPLPNAVLSEIRVLMAVHRSKPLTQVTPTRTWSSFWRFFKPSSKMAPSNNGQVFLQTKDTVGHSWPWHHQKRTQWDIQQKGHSWTYRPSCRMAQRPSPSTAWSAPQASAGQALPLRQETAYHWHWRACPEQHDLLCKNTQQLEQT